MVARRTLSEHDSKELLAKYGARVSRERTVATPNEAVRVANDIGFPVVAKLVGERLAHKSERGLVKLGLRDAAAVESASLDLLARRRDEDGDVSILIAEQVQGSRELIVGMVRDPLFGVVVLVGAGGVTAEAINDTQMRLAPIVRQDLDAMLDQLATREVFGEFRNQREVNRDTLWGIVDAVARAALADSSVSSIDVNPVIVTAQGDAVVVDALVEHGDSTPEPVASRTATNASTDSYTPRHDDAGFRALFDPRGVVVLGASTHPGKFGFVSLHNLLASGYRGKVAATNLSREVVLGVQTVASVSELPIGEFDLAFFCTPASANESLLAECAARGIRAAFVTSAGYGEADGDGKSAEASLVDAARRHGVLLAGPNGQGVVSTPSALCAQIVAPYPPAGNISIASQSGNFVSSFMNLARSTGIGVARAVSAGNAAAVDVADFVEWMSRDSATSSVLSYIEGVTDGHRLRSALAVASQRKPVVIMKGGASAEGARAAASHTGALASNDKVFDGMCRQLGVVRAATVDEAFDAAALFATAPLPRGNRVALLTTAGGWGVVTADALSRDGILRLAELSDDVMRKLDGLLPARWSRNNPVDCAGGETRDTIPAVLEVLATSDAVDAVVYLGIGIQSNQARLMREGGFHPDHGLARIVEYHERQDERFATAAHDLTVSTGKPVIVATELAVADPLNAGPATVRKLGGMCFASGPRAVRALSHAYIYAHHRGVAR
ncbi:MAG: acetate--CoA ligase family protein [Actinomycetota bacterium]